VTDYPASCYTDRIHFSSKSKPDDTDVSLLKVDLGSCEPIDAAPKKPFFKRLFAKEESDMKQEELATALKDALGTPLSEFGQKLDGLATKLDSFSTTKAEGEEHTPSADDENTELAQVKEELLKTKTALGELNDKFTKALKAPAGDTTDADDEPEGEEGKYSNLL